MYLLNVIKRASLYQIFFVLSYYQLKAFGVNAHNYKDKVYEIASHFDFKHPSLDQLLSHPELICQILIGFQILSAALAILGSRLFAFLSVIPFIIDTAVHHNPLMPSKQHSVEVGKFSISTELIVRTAIVFAVLAHTFKSSISLTTKLGLGAGAAAAGSALKDNKREPQSNSKKNKKQI